MEFTVGAIPSPAVKVGRPKSALTLAIEAAHVQGRAVYVRIPEGQEPRAFMLALRGRTGHVSKGLRCRLNRITRTVALWLDPKKEK